MIALAHEEKERHCPVANIKVVGVGGAGGNTINRMAASNYKSVELIAINTDMQALKLSKAHKVIQIGQKSTKGLGAGANPEVGKRAAEEDMDKVLSELNGADIVFLTGGMGGGTGSGALPVIVKALQEKGVLTIVVITKPFAFEGRKRAETAQNAVDAVCKYADTVLIVPNQKLLDSVDAKVSMIEGFEMINEVLNQSVRGISDIITEAGYINVDFADVREIMKNQGIAVMGTGRASGEDRARRAALLAISSPLLENMSIAGACGVLLNISGNASLGLHEISIAASVIYEQADPNANIILGSVIDESLGDEIAVTVIATGFKGTVAPEVVLAAQESLAKELGAAYFYKEPVREVVAEAQVQKIEPVAAPQQAVPVYKEPEPIYTAPLQTSSVYEAPEPVYVAPVQQQEPVYAASQQVAPEAVQQATPVYAASQQAAPVQATPVYVAPAPEPIRVAPVFMQPEPIIFHTEPFKWQEKSVGVSFTSAPVAVKKEEAKAEYVSQAPQQEYVQQHKPEPQKFMSAERREYSAYQEARAQYQSSETEAKNSATEAAPTFKEKDLDIPTFMRKQGQEQQQPYSHRQQKKNKKNKHRYQQQQAQQQQRSSAE